MVTFLSFRTGGGIFLSMYRSCSLFAITGYRFLANIRSGWFECI